MLDFLFIPQLYLVPLLTISVQFLDFLFQLGHFLAAVDGLSEPSYLLAGVLKVVLKGVYLGFHFVFFHRITLPLKYKKPALPQSSGRGFRGTSLCQTSEKWPQPWCMPEACRGRFRASLIDPYTHYGLTWQGQSATKFVTHRATAWCGEWPRVGMVNRPKGTV